MSERVAVGLCLTLVAVLAGCRRTELRTGVVWTPMDFSFEAQQDHPWHAFPATATWSHIEAGERFETEAFWLRDKTWTFRFAPPRAGMWTFETHSEDPGLDGWTGTVRVVEPSADAVAERPSVRGFAFAQAPTDASSCRTTDGRSCSGRIRFGLGTRRERVSRTATARSSSI
ncbi:MAG: DUF5060 domain-containing protein [Bryobacterales bacterium]